MGFKKMTRPKFPPRLWSLVGYPGSGKSSFAAKLKGPMVVVDADHRFTEVMDIAGGEVYQLSDIKSDNVDPDKVAQHLESNMPGSDVKTIIVDSLTAIITPLVVKAMRDNDTGNNKNLVASFRTKALAMRRLQDAVTRWGTDVLWIYHLQDSRDGKAKEMTRATISQTELARLTRSINLELEIVMDKGNPSRRGIFVRWARRGRSRDDVGVLWDESGRWDGMPERIEEAVYAGLSKAEQDAIENRSPDAFASPDKAISWANEKGVFPSPEESRRAYEHVKKSRKPKSAQEMARYWVEHVEELVQKMLHDPPAPSTPEEPPAAPAPKRSKRRAAQPEPTMEDIVF